MRTLRDGAQLTTEGVAIAGRWHPFSSAEHLRTLKPLGIYVYEHGPPDPPKPWPNHLIVASVHRVRDRVFPHGEQPLVDWVVVYRDGTADAISRSPAQGAPRVGHYLNRDNYLRLLEESRPIWFARWDPVDLPDAVPGEGTEPATPFWQSV